MSNSYNIEELLGAFSFSGELKSTDVITDGHINNTFVFTFEEPNNQERKYLIQQLNTSIFHQPIDLMNNIIGVTNFLRKKILEEGGDIERECLRVCPAKNGKPYFIDSNDRFWRCFNFISDTHSIQTIENPDDFKASAKAFGKFQCMLADYPIETLAETIPNFHNTKSRFKDFTKAVADNISGRKNTCIEEIDFVLSRENDCSILVDLIDEGKLPIRVTHNDTKLNNVMFDNKTNHGICIVDLDTVMPGLSLYDFGDSIRFGASTAAEDEKDLDKVHFSMEYFNAYVEGYLEEVGKALTQEEINYLPFASKLMTLECGMRFLGDYINGDTYFKTEYPEHNLVRARTQFKLVSEMEENMDEMKKVVQRVYSSLN